MQKIFSVLILLSFTLLNFVLSQSKRSLTSLELDKSNWSFDSTNGVYYQIDVAYCTNQVSPQHQSMAIYVPQEYLTCTAQESEKYNCLINLSGQKGNYTSSNAPIVMPVETPGYAAMKAPTSYSYDTVSEYIENGIVFAYAGCRGRYEGSETYIAGAPWPVTDLKSAIRYLRYNKDKLPGSTDKIYTFGMSGGGAQSCLMGVTGNSELYTKYIEENGAAMKDANGNALKDNVKGSQCWCPITNLDTADAAYEWNIGQYYSTDTRADGTFTKLLSDDLSAKFVEYINSIELKDPSGNKLSLTSTNSGSYYDYLKKIIEESLNNFLSDTSFPWTRAAAQEYPRGGDGENEKEFKEKENLRRLDGETYENPSDYIAYLNTDNNWVAYDSSTNKATITNVADFVKACKPPSKDVGAFDDLNRGQGENQVFGTAPEDYKKHFDQIAYNLLNSYKGKYSIKSDWNSNYPSDYLNDFDDTDSVGNHVLYRLNMYNPMYYLNKHYAGYRTSDVADYFRINTGIFQSDTGNVVEIDLYLALLNYGKNVEFTTVWEQKHVKAERAGDSDTNFINWIAEIEKKEAENRGSESFSNSISISYVVLILSLIFTL